jgi:hypothetical protein
MLLLTGLSLSVGWGIRGNFGHEYGAMIPGALAAMAVVLTSGREDWWRRVAYFATFGALGWSFGGSISYMQVVAYTHSGHSASVLYGFACLFVIGFLWAAPGGAGTALAACWDRERLTEMFAPMTAVFVAWWLQGIAIVPALLKAFALTERDLDWYDTDWLAALLAVVAVVVLALVRRRWDRASELILHMALGWWAAFLILVVLLGIRMTPPRGDNWAGCLGLVVGVLIYCGRQGLSEVVLASLVTGILGGIGFAAASMLKLVEVTSGLETNWHSILEQTTGLFNGLALAVAMIVLARRVGVAGTLRRAELLESSKELSTTERAGHARWTEVYAAGFVLVLITYLNLSKNPRDWVQHHTMPATMYGLPARMWFDIAYALLAVAVLVPLVRHLYRPLAVLPASWLGRAQGLYLVFLWWMVAGNFERALVGFAPQRLVTEGVIHLNAVLCTLLALLAAVPAGDLPDRSAGVSTATLIRRFVAIGLVAAALSILVDWGIVRAIYGDRFAGHAGLHIRFGPRATIHERR